MPSGQKCHGRISAWLDSERAADPMKSFDSRVSAYGIILGVTLMVIVYAILHDQYVVRIAPEHFTVFHEPLWSITNASLLAAAYALQASAVPGLILGFSCFAVGRLGSWPKVPPKAILMGAAAVIGATELVAASSGLLAWALQRGIFPAFVYPESSLPLIVTQTIQISCYAASALFSGIFLLGILVHRRSALRNDASSGKRSVSPPHTAGPTES